MRGLRLARLVRSTCISLNPKINIFLPLSDKKFRFRTSTAVTDSDLNQAKMEPEKIVIGFWNTMITEPPKQFQRLSVGINGNMDVIVGGIDLLKTLNLQPDGKKTDHPTVNSLVALQESFSYFFSEGRAAERPFTNKGEYQKILAATETMSDVQHHIGGNAALMALSSALLFPYAHVQFVGPVGPRLLGEIPKNIEIPEISRLDKDETHLIMEFKVGQKWGDLEAPVATRFIATYDETNSKGLMMETFFDSIKTFKPDLILLSGLNIMDGQEHNFFMQRLDKMITLCKEVPATTPIHLELASQANPDFVKAIVERGIHFTDSLGFNEAELLFLSDAAEGPHRDIIDPASGQPRIHQISDTLFWLLKKYGRSPTSPGGKLSRVHFHCLTYHILAVEKGRWSNIDMATVAGARVAGLQAGGVPHLDSNDVFLRMPETFKCYSGDIERSLDLNNPFIHWEKEGFSFVMSPVLIFKKPVKTVGLGDAISATGLMYQEFKV